MIMYYAIYYLDQIAKVEVVKETEAFVTVKKSYGDVREKKSSGYHSFHTTFDKAKDALIQKEKLHLESLKNQMEYHQEKLERIEKMTEAS